MPSQAKKQLARLAMRQVAAPVGKGFRRPGSMNRHKSFPLSKPKGKV